MTGYSLRRRLLAWLLASTAVLGLLALADTRAEALRTAQGVSDRVLAGSAIAIAERVSVDVQADGALVADVPYSALEMLSSAAQDRVFYRIDGPAGFLTGYDALPVVADDGDGLGLADTTFLGTPIRLATLYRRAATGFEGTAFTVTVAESTRARRALADTILLRSALRLAGMIAGAAAIVWVAVTLALRPLDRLGEALAQRSPDDLRPLTAAAPAEVQGLVGAINGFMARLGSALAALRNFSGNAGHQIRTPLAVARAQLALAGRAADGGARQAALAKADAALVQAERVLRQLLLLARLDAAGPGAASATPVDLGALARDLVADRVPLAAERGMDLGFDGQAGLYVRGEAVLLGEALGNLLDNALAYAGPGATVTLIARETGAEARLTVIDDGPGLPADRRARLAQPRGPLAEPGPGGGLGLGLSIVAEIARAFDGQLVLEAGPGGRGLAAELRLPLLGAA
ncbi:MAG: sensor histidine kinase [Rhodobacterales bacterium]|nr:sensor histidine kinase [Rhodobacterales bacterium]